MGTPNIAAECLSKIIEEGKHEICAVFTKEDKPVGRKQILTPPPVKVVATENNIPVYQPKTLRDLQVQNIIKNLNPDIIVVVAYGVILPIEVLSTPKNGAINLHVSLLPKYRGAAPIQWAVINGETKTGVTIMQLNEGLDTGDIIDVLPINIESDETSGELMQKVTQLGSKFLCKTLLNIQNNNISTTPQNNELATYAPQIDKSISELDFNLNAQKLHNLIRGLSPWPYAYLTFNQNKIKVTKSKIYTLTEKESSLKPYCIVKTKPLIIKCGKDALILEKIVPQGKNEMEGAVWANGRRLMPGDFLV